MIASLAPGILFVPDAFCDDRKRTTRPAGNQRRTQIICGDLRRPYRRIPHLGGMSIANRVRQQIKSAARCSAGNYR